MTYKKYFIDKDVPKVRSFDGKKYKAKHKTIDPDEARKFKTEYVKKGYFVRVYKPFPNEPRQIIYVRKKPKKKMSKINIEKIKETVTSLFVVDPINDEIKFIERQTKLYDKDVESIKNEIKRNEEKLFYLNKKLEYVKNDKNQLKILKKELEDRINADPIEKNEQLRKQKI